MTSVASASQEHESFFEKVWEEIKSVFKKTKDEAVTIEHSIAVYADEVTNVLKSIEANKFESFLANELISIAEKVEPKLVPLIAGLELEIPKILAAISKTSSESLPDQAEEFIQYLQTVKGISGTIFAGILGTINAAIQFFFTSNSGIVASDSHLLVTGQIVHAS